MKKTLLALTFGLMSVACIAQTRQLSTNLPASTPTVTFTINGEDHNVKPTKASVQEKDASHIECKVFAGRDKASVVLPISFDKALQFSYIAAEKLHELGYISDNEWNAFLREYERQTR